MPIFDYRCMDCSEEFEFFVIRSDDTPSCPKCSGLNLTKRASLFSVGSSTAQSPTPVAKQPEESGHKCTSSCNHGSKSNSHGHDAGPHVGCARVYADSLRDKYGY